MQVSQFANNIEPSATLKAAALARELRAKGAEVLDFCLGEPDFDTPEHIRLAAKKAMDSGKTHYTAATGILELKKAICDYHQRMHGLSYSPAQICVSNGCKHTIYTALCATLNPGDEVVIPTPYWVSYRDLVQMTGAKAVLVQTKVENGLKMTGDEFRRACTPRTKLLLLNSPCNPTGAVYSETELRALAETVVERDLICLTDEIYEQLIFGPSPFKAFGALGPDVFKRTLTVNGVSKSYAMTGWRIGWTAAPIEVAKAMDAVQSQQTSCPSSVSQYAALEALNADQSSVVKMRQEFAERREFVCSRLPEMPGLRLSIPDGAFYAFFDVSSYFGKTFGGVKVTNSNTFCQALLQQAHVNLVEGGAFGAEGYVRLSFAASMESLERGLDALEQWLRTAH